MTADITLTRIFVILLKYAQKLNACSMAFTVNALLINKTGKVPIRVENGELSIYEFGKAIGYAKDDKRFFHLIDFSGDSLVNLFPAIERLRWEIHINKISCFNRYVNNVVANPLYTIGANPECLLKDLTDANHFGRKLDLDCFLVWANAL